MAANRVSSSIQGDQVPAVGRRPLRARVIGTILVAGLIVGMFAVPVGSVSAELLVDPCLTCVSERTIGANAARHTALAAFYAAGDELASPAVAASAARHTALAAFLAARSEASVLADAARYSGLAAFHAAADAATAVRFNDSGAASSAAAPAVAAAAARYDALVEFYAKEYRPALVAQPYNDSGVAAAVVIP